MKNILIPLLILIFVIGAGVAEALIIDNIFDDFIARTEEMITLAENEQLSVKEYDQFDKMWYEVREKSEFFLPHNDVYELNLRVAEIRGYVENGDFENCLVQLQVVKKISEYVRHLSKPKLRHIL